MRTGPANVASLFVIRGLDQGRRFLLEAQTIGVGREPSNLVRLNDTEVSRRHAEVRHSGSTFTVSDLGSSNGTWVNGQRVQNHQLTSGDQLQLGSTLMLFTSPGDESSHGVASKIDIVGRNKPGDESRIVHSVSQQESQAFFRTESEISQRADGSQSQWLSRARGNLEVMYRAAMAVSHTLDIDLLLDRILELVFEWVDADHGCVLLVDQRTKELVPTARRSRKGLSPDERLQISQSILDYVVEHREGVLTTDAREDERFNPAGSIVRLGIREALCVPMQGRYDLVGVLYVDTSTPPNLVTGQRPNPKFSEDHLKLLVAVGQQAALATEDTRYYSAMVQAERMAAIGHTIAVLSHHIKNILQGIRGGSYLIEQGLSSHNEEHIRKGWTFVERNQEKISHLVLDMLSFSKEREPDLEPAQLNDVARDVVELQAARAKDLGVDVACEPAVDMPKLMLDADALHRAILNVVTNAIDACEGREEGPGRVMVRTQLDPEAHLARVIIEDNGGGIPLDHIEDIFNVFTSSKGTRGTGLGLPVSRKILREHGGDIRVESEMGKGSRFILEFPATAPEPVRHTSVYETDPHGLSPPR